jgi:hypothetical protein
MGSEARDRDLIHLYGNTGRLRHLHSLRRMKRDNGWIETHLEESYNERMHFLTFLKVVESGPFMRLIVSLEGEAALAYTRDITDLDAGRLME